MKVMHESKVIRFTELQVILCADAKRQQMPEMTSICCRREFYVS